MMAVQRQRFCRGCKRKILHERQQVISTGMGCLITIITGGLFLLAWIPLGLLDIVFQPWRCQVCGRSN